MDKKHGKGDYRWADGRIYSGEWLEGKQHGIGFMLYPNNKVKKAKYDQGNKIEEIEMTAEEEQKIQTENEARSELEKKLREE